MQTGMIDCFMDDICIITEFDIFIQFPQCTIKSCVYTNTRIWAKAGTDALGCIKGHFLLDIYIYRRLAEDRR